MQAQLADDEVLVLVLDMPEWGGVAEETFVWAITKKDVRWVRSDLGRKALTREVQALRCGLDYLAWQGSGCRELTGTQYALEDYLDGKALPFDLPRAHRLYKVLLGKFADLIKGKQLLLVLSGPLTQLPFQVLVSEPPANDDLKRAAWLVRDHAVTVLPAVSSLAALRRIGRPSLARKPYVGFGNPLLDGPDSRYADYARQAREKQSCAYFARQRVARGLPAAAGSSPLQTGVTTLQMNGATADTVLLRRFSPLPETADELCAVAQDIAADANATFLGASATEHAVKAASESGLLAQYRFVHFATHGAMAGELRGSADPGLVLTPPQTASEDDDGYLSASEIAALKLDADWVILSSCNTAAGAAANAEALSGLVRAFIYAQAQALLVSHWAVDSAATVKLITITMHEIANDKSVGGAQALRRAMLALIEKGEGFEAHPAYWAPFIVVGEGARR